MIEKRRGMRDVNNTRTMQVTSSLAMSADESGAMICINGQEIGSMLPLKSDRRVVAGRDPSVSNYVIPDPRVSGKHFEITYIGALKKYRVVDYSHNGTFLKDGSRLQMNQEYYLPPKTELWVGSGNIYKLR